MRAKHGKTLRPQLTKILAVEGIRTRDLMITWQKRDATELQRIDECTSDNTHIHRSFHIKTISKTKYFAASS